MQTSFQQNLHLQNNLAYERAAAEKARDKYEVLVDELGQVWCKNCNYFRTNLLMNNNRSCLFFTEPDDNSLPTIFLDSLDSRKPSTPRFHISLTPIFFSSSGFLHIWRYERICPHQAKAGLIRLVSSEKVSYYSSLALYLPCICF